MAIRENSSELPNLKIEIENDLDEVMEIDSENNAQNKISKEDSPEEGELSDSKENDTEVKTSVFGLSMSTSNIPTWDREKRYENKGGAFVTGVDIFAKEEQMKLDERAKRFGLDPSDAKPVTEQQIIELYKSLGMKDEEGTEKHFRLNTLHVRGTENMSTQDIFNYFKDYGPASIEWINDYSCNVVWIDNLSAARAMIGLSKHVKGLDEFHSKANPFLKEGEKEKESDKENEKEEVVVVQEIEEPDGDDIIMVMERSTPFTQESQMNVDSDEVNASDIPIPIPPGKWRKGTSHPKAKCILLRFSTRTDKKQPQSEKMSEYYKKYGNPNYGGIKGLITSSRKRRYQWHEHDIKVFEDDKGDERDFSEVLSDEKNPWGNLAKSWSKLDKNRSRRKPDSYSVINSSRPRSFPTTPPSSDEHQSMSVLHRFGTVTAAPVLKSDSEDASKSVESDEESEWTKRSKIPRMRMYADEEEVRIERRKAQVQAQSRRKQDRDVRNNREKVSRYEDQERRRRRRRSSSAHKESSRPHSRNKDSNQRKSKPFESFDEDTTSRTHDLRSRLDRDGKSKVRGGVNVVTSTVWDRLNHHQAGDAIDWEQETSGSDSDVNDLQDDDRGSYSDMRGSLLQGEKNSSRFEGGDLRSKLNLKKTMRQTPLQKSPLRIEIDNDEYYRLIGSDHE